MAIDFNHPITTDNYATLLQFIRDNSDALCQMLNETLTMSNYPTNSVRWNITNNRFEIWNGTAWGILTAKLLMDIDTLDGQHGSFYQNAGNLNAGLLPAARFDDTAHGSRTGGTTHNAVTTTVNGFMTAADKSKLDGVEAGAKADQTAAEILALLLTVDGPGSGLNADLLDGLQASSLAPITSPNFSGTPAINSVAIPTKNDTNYGAVQLDVSYDIAKTAVSLTLREPDVPLGYVHQQHALFNLTTGQYQPLIAGYYFYFANIFCWNLTSPGSIRCFRNTTIINSSIGVVSGGSYEYKLFGTTYLNGSTDDLILQLYHGVDSSFTVGTMSHFGFGKFS